MTRANEDSSRAGAVPRSRAAWRPAGGGPVGPASPPSVKVGVLAIRAGIAGHGRHGRAPGHRVGAERVNGAGSGPARAARGGGGVDRRKSGAVPQAHTARIGSRCARRHLDRGGLALGPWAATRRRGQRARRPRRVSGTMQNPRWASAASTTRWRPSWPHPHRRTGRASRRGAESKQRHSSGTNAGSRTWPSSRSTGWMSSRGRAVSEARRHRSRLTSRRSSGQHDSLLLLVGRRHHPHEAGTAVGALKKTRGVFTTAAACTTPSEGVTRRVSSSATLQYFAARRGPPSSAFVAEYKGKDNEYSPTSVTTSNYAPSPGARGEKDSGPARSGGQGPVAKARGHEATALGQRSWREDHSRCNFTRHHPHRNS